MNTLDLLIALALAAGVARGFATGVVRQVANVLGLIISFSLAVQLMHPVGGVVAGSLGVSERVAPLLGFLLILVAVQVAAYAVVRAVEGLLGALKITVVNRVLGGAFGAFKAALLLSIAFLVLGFFGLPGSQTSEASQLYGPVASVLPQAWDFLSERLPEVERLSESFGERIREELPGQ